MFTLFRYEIIYKYLTKRHISKMYAGDLCNSLTWSFLNVPPRWFRKCLHSNTKKTQPTPRGAAWPISVHPSVAQRCPTSSILRRSSALSFPSSMPGWIFYVSCPPAFTVVKFSMTDTHLRSITKVIWIWQRNTFNFFKLVCICHTLFYVNTYLHHICEQFKFMKYDRCTENWEKVVIHHLCDKIPYSIRSLHTFRLQICTKFDPLHHKPANTHPIPEGCGYFPYPVGLILWATLHPSPLPNSRVSPRVALGFKGGWRWTCIFHIDFSFWFTFVFTSKLLEIARQ